MSAPHHGIWALRANDKPPDLDFSSSSFLSAISSVERLKMVFFFFSPKQRWWVLKPPLFSLAISTVLALMASRSNPPEALEVARATVGT
jgi:hypothetical protein